MRELNKLTQRLLAEGYTKENPPDFVRTWNDFYGGWEYTFKFQKNLVFKTGCGLLVRGDRWSSGTMYYMGVTWSLENGNPVTRCPYYRSVCEKNNPLLKNCKACDSLLCCCEETAEPYTYENSIDKVNDEQREEEQRLFEQFRLQKHDRIQRLMAVVQTIPISRVLKTSHQQTELPSICMHNGLQTPIQLSLMVTAVQAVQLHQ